MIHLKVWVCELVYVYIYVSVCAIMHRSVSPGCVNAHAVCVDCVLNACSSYPLPQWSSAWCVPEATWCGATGGDGTPRAMNFDNPVYRKTTGGRRWRNPHRPQRADRPRLPAVSGSARQPYLALPLGGGIPDPAASLVLRGTYAVQCKVNKGRKAVG